MEWKVSTFNRITETEPGEAIPRVVGTVVRKEDMPMIAAAPEMYEALNWLIHLSHDTGKKGGRPEPGEWEEAIKQGEQALQKVRDK